jgi:hypothetical protein
MAESIVKTLTVTNGAYTAKDVAGGLITFTPESPGKKYIINSVKLAGVVAIPYSLVFLSSDIATPAADNAAFALAAADQVKYKGHVSIAAADYVADSAAAFNLATVDKVGLQIQTTNSTGVFYAYLVAEAVTSPGTTTIILTVDIEELG